MKTSPKSSTAARHKTVAAQPSEDERMVILVRRGALRRFDALTEKTTELPVVISWDRRQTDRRRSAAAGTVERRRTDRRQAPPFTWELADFIVLPGTTFDTAEPPTNTVAPAASARPRPKGRSRKPTLKAVRRKRTPAR